jgi:glycosyltransferase involved in cell wall biosynthesis
VLEQRCVRAEQIIIDGGSTDGTVDIAASYASQCDRIRWLSEADQGQSHALNKGVSLARGDILGILNVDDFYEIGALNRILMLFEGLQKPALLVGNCNVLGEDGSLLSINKPQHLRLYELLLGPRVNPTPINPSAYFYHSNLHKLIGGYDVNDHFTMDWDFIFRAVQVANVRYVDEVFGNYRLVSGAKTVEDMRSGQNKGRANRLLKKYRSGLPLHVRYWITLCAWLCDNDLYSTLRYFTHYPYEISYRLRARLSRAERQL